MLFYVVIQFLATIDRRFMSQIALSRQLNVAIVI